MDPIRRTPFGGPHSPPLLPDFRGILRAIVHWLASTFQAI